MSERSRLRPDVEPSSEPETEAAQGAAEVATADVSVPEVIETLLEMAQIPRTDAMTPEGLVRSLVPCLASDRRFLETVCRLEDVVKMDELLTGAHLRTLVQHLKTANDDLLARSVQQARPRQVTADDVPLHIAAEVMYWHLYPDTQERLQMAMENNDRTLAALMLGTFGRFKDSFGDADMTDVPAVAFAAMPQSGASASPRPSVGMSQVSALQPSICECCQEAIVPPPGSRKMKFRYHETCGDLAYKSQNWAGNVARTSDMADRPWPDPYECRIPQERWERVKAWQEEAIPRMLDEARKKVRSLPGAA